MGDFDSLKPGKLVDRINDDLETIRGEGIDAWGVGVGAGGSVVVYMTDENPEWQGTLRARYGDRLQFHVGAMPGLLSKASDE